MESREVHSEWKVIYFVGIHFPPEYSRPDEFPEADLIRMFFFLKNDTAGGELPMRWMFAGAASARFNGPKPPVTGACRRAVWTVTLHSNRSPH